MKKMVLAVLFFVPCAQAMVPSVFFGNIVTKYGGFFFSKGERTTSPMDVENPLILEREENKKNGALEEAKQSLKKALTEFDEMCAQEE